MPTYRVTAPTQQLDAARRARLAQAITAAHHAATGAPRFYVQVLFVTLVEGMQFIGGGVPEEPQVFLEGTIRAGRTSAQKDRLMDAPVTAISACLVVPRRSVWVYLTELPAEQMAEFGTRLPAAGGEDAWFSRLSPDQQAYMQKMDRPAE